MSGQIRFRWRRLTHDPGTGLLFRSSLRSRGVTLIVAPQPRCIQLVDLAFEKLRQDGRGDLAGSIRMCNAIAMAARSCKVAGDRRALQQHAEVVRDGLAPSFLLAARQRFVRRGCRPARRATRRRGP